MCLCVCVCVCVCVGMRVTQCLLPAVSRLALVGHLAAVPVDQAAVLAVLLLHLHLALALLPRSVVLNLHR